MNNKEKALELAVQSADAHNIVRVACEIEVYLNEETELNAVKLRNDFYLKALSGTQTHSFEEILPFLKRGYEAGRLVHISLFKLILTNCEFIDTSDGSRYFF